MATKPPSKSAKPAAKAPATSTAVAKRSSGNVVDIKAIQEKLKAQAAEMNERVAPPSGISISIKNSEFRMPDGVKTSEAIELVVVDFVAANAFYEGAFDASNVVPPTCYAVGPNPMKLEPLEESPAQQSTSCTGCPMNEFGSQGKGKACKNQRVLAVLPPDADENTPLWKLTVPPTSTKAWDAFVRQVSAMYQMPPVSAIVSVSFTDADFPQLTFNESGPNEQLAVHFARQDEARKLLMAAPDFSQAVTKPAPRKAAGGARARR
jgi:hypothetical protein